MMVRENVGVCDVSTLGKIDIQGKDAAKLLDFHLYQHVQHAKGWALCVMPDAA
jgi:glycine cleavage system aminomethyltransferase T